MRLETVRRIICGRAEKTDFHSGKLIMIIYLDLTSVCAAAVEGTRSITRGYRWRVQVGDLIELEILLIGLNDDHAEDFIVYLRMDGALSILPF